MFPVYKGLYFDLCLLMDSPVIQWYHDRPVCDSLLGCNIIEGFATLSTEGSLLRCTMIDRFVTVC